MLASLTTTAVTRSWHPAVYSRLVLQLQELSDIESSRTALGTYKTLITTNPPSPLLCEYICTLSKDTHSPIFFPVILNWLADDETPRTQRLKEFVCYIGRFAEEEWILPPEYSEFQSLAEVCQKLILQALMGVEESRILVNGLVASVIPKLISELPDWKPECEQALKRLGIPLQLFRNIEEFNDMNSRKNSLANQSETKKDDDGSHNGTSGTQGHSSRALRLLWLDWFLKTAQPPQFANFRKQLDIAWPGDRDTVISYELCITAFDVLASPNSSTPPILAEAFITKALPLLLLQMGFDKPIDSVIARVFTTLDKAVVENVEQRRPGIRAEFGIACVDIGLCDPTVLHAIHRSHKPREALPSSALPSVEDIILNISQFLDMNPLNQQEIAGNIAMAARGTSTPLGRQNLAILCTQILRSPDFADILFVFISVRDFLECICAYANMASILPDEDGATEHIYSDLGTLLAAIEMLRTRYQHIVLPSGWATEYIEKRKFANLTELTVEQSSLMGSWIIGLFSGSGSGIADELLLPFKDLGEILPVVLRQAVRAYRSAVIDRDTLKSGLDYFAHPFSVTVMAPLVVRILKIDLFECTHQATTLECLIFFLNIISQKKDTAFDIAKAIVLRIAKETLAELTATDISFNRTDTGYANSNSNIKKLKGVFVNLVNELSQQVSTNFFIPAPKSFGLGETISFSESVKASTAALMSWQLKPQGVPIIPSGYDHAKSALGLQETKSLIDQATASQSPDTAIALLVADGLWSKEDQLLNIDESHVSIAAREVWKKFVEIIMNQPKLPDVVISEVKTSSAGNKEKSTSETSSAAYQKDDNVASVAASSTFPPPKEEAISVGEIGMLNEVKDSMGYDAFDGSIDPIGQNLPGEFDNDFSSQPMMNLADLDSAMDFAWD